MQQAAEDTSAQQTNIPVLQVVGGVPAQQQQVKDVSWVIYFCSCFMSWTNYHDKAFITPRVYFGMTYHCGIALCGNVAAADSF